MPGEQDMYLADYVSIEITANGSPAEIFNFSTNEIREGIEYTGPFATDLIKTMAATAYSFGKSQVENWKIKVRAYENAKTRQKLFRISQLIQGNYSAKLTIKRFTAAFGTYPFSHEPSRDENARIEIIEPSVVIEFPADVAIDIVKRGIGALKGIEVELSIFKSAILQFPVDPCSLLTANNFSIGALNVNEPSKTFNSYVPGV